METLRTFIAFPLPAPVRDHIQSIQEKFREAGFRLRWVKPENVHLTLKFLGDVASSDIDRISGAMDKAVRSAPILFLGTRGLGVFPGIRRPRVLWVGLTGETQGLIEIQKQLDAHLGTAGFDPDTRPYKAHLTIARVKGTPDARALAAAMTAHGAVESPPFTTEEMVLYRSELKPDGAVYTRLHASPLKDADSGDR